MNSSSTLTSFEMVYHLCSSWYAWNIRLNVD